MGREEKNAVITASASGIGLVVAKTLRREGWRVLISDIDIPAGQAAAKTMGVDFKPCDLKDPTQIEALFDGMERIDLLVNNAGIMGPSCFTWECPLDGWRETLDINLTAQFLACKAAVPRMIKAGSGVIINMSSMAGRHAWPTRAAYGVSKWAVLGLTATLAREVGEFGVRVNAILPGAVRGERIMKGIAAYAEANQISLEDAENYYVSRQATKKFVEPEEIAETILFLASDRAKSITGQFIQVCGGFE
jgi:NAD(P)-dependent dehydrogenase (short-subunit alcohol dehydrogenase family)